MSGQKLLIIGSGGREHALAWKLACSPQVAHIYVAPGNAGTNWPANPEAVGLQPRAACENMAIRAEDIPALMAFARRNEIDLTIVGPEVPLVAGIADTFQTVDLPIFGPGHQAAKLEGSKAFAKEFMQRWNIPTADFAIFEDYQAAKNYVQGVSHPLVVKADGLAAGKGVIICDTTQEAETALKRIMVDQEFGEAGDKVVIEARLSGREISLMAWCDGQTIVPIIPARDHKQVFDGDKGPNTGGMGVYAPAPDIDSELVETIQQTVLLPTIAGMAKQGIPYVGILYAGLMLTEAGPQVLEFNCRFGDPETQAILPLLKTDLLDIFKACLTEKLGQLQIEWQSAACATIVLASQGYPGPYPKDKVITGLETVSSQPNVLVFQAGTAQKNNQIVTAGGRVLGVSAIGETLATALDQAYAATEKISFAGAHYRRDIGASYRS